VLEILLSNTLSQEKELFSKATVTPVKLYVCGITPYDYAHVGHGRVYVTFDVLYRLLRTLGYEVHYCRNFTDIDDKLINRAQKELGDGSRFIEIAQKFIDTYHQDMEALNCLPPTYEPRVTQTIPEIISLVQTLIDRGHAYQVGSDVYYSINSFKGYGKLSKRTLEDMEAGARVEVREDKKNPYDFALWKGAKEAPYWESPWGPGRPGWHIECSAMVKKFLGDHIDIHGGGMDLIFPHHENEIAQTEGATGKQMSRFWMHNAFVRINQEKMSKSLGNFFTLRDLFEKFDPMVVRFMLLQHQYRSPLDFSLTDLEVAQKTYQRLCKMLYRENTNMSCQPKREQKSGLALNHASHILPALFEFLCDDLNTPGMFGVVFEHAARIQSDESERAAVAAFLQDIVGLTLVPLAEKHVEITPEIQKLIDEREAARYTKDWARADALREQLKELGYEAQDKKQ